MGEFVRRKRTEESTAADAGRDDAEQASPSTIAVPGDIDRLIVQAKLSVGPAGDRFEREADAVADRVVRSLQASPSEQQEQHDDTVARTPITGVQRSAEVGLAGGDLDSGTANDIQSARGGGKAMPSPMRSRMEGAFSADFSGVRVHEGSQSAELNDRIQAKAFTVGSDIFFRDRIPDVSSSDGQRLVAHELTHTIQQGASAQRTLQRKSVDGAQARSNVVPPVVSEHRPASIVQAKFGKKVKSFGKKVKTLFGKASKSDVTDEAIESPILDDASHDDKMKHARQTKGSGPGENPDYSNTKLWGAEPNGFRITLAVAQERAGWMEDVNALRKAALSNPGILMKALGGQGVEIPDPNGTGTLTANPQDVITQIAYEARQGRGENEGEEERSLDEFSDGIHDVGHTWVRLDTLVDGEVKQRYSYGMWPQKMYDPSSGDNEGGYAGFIDAGPGEVRHPDTEHEGDALTAYQDYTVGRTNWNKAHQMAVKRFNNPPPYVLTGYNCTAFAREIVRTGGGSYPGSGLLPGFGYTPGNLYAAILKKTAKNRRGVRTGANDADTAITSRIDDRHGAWGQAGKKAADDKHDAIAAPVAKATPTLPTLRFYGKSGDFKAPGADAEPTGEFTFQTVTRLMEQGNTGNGFIEIMEYDSGNFYWIKEDEYNILKSGGSLTPEAVADESEVEEAIAAPMAWDDLIAAIKDTSMDGMGAYILSSALDGGGYGVTNADIKVALLTDTDERAKELAVLIEDHAALSDVILSFWGPNS